MHLFVALVNLKKQISITDRKYFNSYTYTSHVDGTPERTSNTGTENEESGVNKELISGTTEEQESVGRSLIEQG